METSRGPRVYLYRRIVLAKLYMDQYFAEPINLDLIAGKAFISKFHFIRIFKQLYGRTPHQYLTDIRVKHAARLLAENKSVANVCYDVGFESISSFTGLFKRLIGSTPSSYQQQQFSRKEAVRNQPLFFIPNCFASANGWTNNSNFQEAIS